MKDNSTGKEKDFYELGKKMFDRLNPHIAHKPKVVGPVQEPVAWMIYTKDGQSVYVTDNPTDIQEGQRALPLYTTPPKRQPLTDKQILADKTLRYYFGQNGGAGPVSKQGRRVVDAIEAAHGIKELRQAHAGHTNEGPSTFSDAADLLEALAQPVTTLTLVEKTKKTCGTCEALARTVMLDQTSHDRHKREWVGLNGDHMDDITSTAMDKADAMLLTESKLKELNHAA